MAVKHIDIGEFRKLGFLQEANRLFFHPHGLALEITYVREGEDWNEPSPAMQTRVDWLADVLRRNGVADDASTDLAKAVLTAQYPPGSRHLSGVWDYRDDPEGVVMGDWDDEKWAVMVEAVRTERAKHYFERAKMFGSDPQHLGAPQYAAAADIEPVGWKPSPEQIAAWEKQGEEANADA